MVYQHAGRQKRLAIRSHLSAGASRATLLMLVAATTVALSTGLISSSLASKSASALSLTPQSTKAEIAERYGKLPLSFERNEGQTDREVKFLSRGPGYDLFLTATDAVLTLRKPRPSALTEQRLTDQPREASVLRLKMVGANPRSRAEGQLQLPGKVNYLVGDDPDKWRINIPTYRKVYYTDIYPKVDLVYYGNRTELEFDFVVAPGGNVRAIGFQVDGIDRMMLDDEGNLRLAVKQDQVTLRKPVIYQLTDKGERREVEGAYVIKGKEVRFKTGAFEADKPLIIDPILSYSTLLGSGGNEHAAGIAVDSSGSAYITGRTDSFGFPTTPGAFQTSGGVFGSAFVTKLDPTGTSLVYSTYLRGSNGNGRAAGTAIAVDSSGNAYVTGNTDSSDFPTVNPIRSSTSNFYKSVDSGGNWNSQVIGPPGGSLGVLAIDPLAPNTMYAGVSQPSGILKTTDGGNSWTPLNTGLINPSCGVLVLDPSNPSTIYASLTEHDVDETNRGLYKSTNGGGSWTLLSNGLGLETVSALAINPSSPSTIYAGVTFVGVFKSTNGGASWTNSSTGITFGGTHAIAVDPVTPQTVYLSAGGGGVFKSTNGGANWAQSNTGLTSTQVRTLTIDPASNVYAGTSGGGVFKSTNSGGNWTPVNNGMSNFIPVSSVALSSSASTTLYLGTGDGRIFRTTDGGNNWTKVYETLTQTNFSTLAINPGAPSTVYAGASISGSSLNDDEAFVSKLNANGSALIYSTYLGGNGDDFGNGIAVDSSGRAVVVGQTASSSFPTLNAQQSTLSGPSDAFVTKFNGTGDALLYSTYLGGGSRDAANSAAVDGTGNAYVTGTTASANFPTLNPFQSTIGDTFNGDAFATKLNSNGALVYSTYLGGEGFDTGYGIAADALGNAYITGLTTSISFPLSNPIQASNGGAAGDAFVTKLNGAGSGLIYSTFLGGSGEDGGRGIAVDSVGNAYVAGHTGSPDFPVVAGALRTKSPFFKSTNGGGSWNNDNYGLKSDRTTALALDPTKPTTVYAGTHNNFYKSTDGGQNWNASSTGLVQPNVLALVVNPATPSTIYMAIGFGQFGNSAGVYKSTDSGSTWNAANNGLTNTSVLSLAIDPVTPSTLYAGVHGTGIFKTVNGGANWTLATGQNISFIAAIVVDPTTPTTLYAGGEFSNGRIYKSTDGGAIWVQTINASCTSLAIDPATPSTIYANTDQGLLKSTNGGTSWNSLNHNFSGPITLDPVTPTTLYVLSSGFSGGGVFKSIDGGINFTPMNNGLTYPFVTSLAINPTSPAIVYVGVHVFPGDNDAFVAKLNPSGTALSYSTLLGGSPGPGDSLNRNDEGFAIAVDSAGNAYVAGASRSPDFPVTPKAFQPFNRGFTDAFVSKLIMSYIISGHVRDTKNAPVGGAQVTLSNGTSLSSFVTEGDGAYRFSHLREGGNFTVSAAKPGFTMAPPSQTFNNLLSNQTVDFIATPTGAPFYSISGSITENGAPLSGVAVTLSGSQQGITTTNGNGLYSFTLAGGGNYTVSPSLVGFTFTPPSQTFNNLGADQTADFAALRQTFVVINKNNHGTGSLRQAILNANATVGLDMIAFNIPGPGVQTINLQFALPEITDPVVIDATTQPGYAGTPLIELNGDQVDSGSGFRISAGGSTIRGFIIGGFESGILLNGGSNNVVQGNYIGLDSTGTVGHSNSSGGIAISNSSNNLIGGTTAAARNVISGNGFDGVAVTGSGNLIQGNFIGTNASGTAAVPSGSDGIDIGGTLETTNNTVGGTAAGAGNLISGNDGRGIRSISPGTVIQGNLIGTNAAGTAAIGNGTGIDSDGPNALVGGTVPGARNIISGNTGTGVSIGASGSRLQGNFIGTDPTGTAVLGNGGSGVAAGNGVLIGGTTPEARNVISGNGGSGNISLGFNSSGPAATVQGNYIGTDVTGNVALNNPQAGISISGSSNLIGGLTPGAQNVISGNRVGIQIGGSIFPGPTGNTIHGNLIGLNALGVSPLPNSLAGISISDSSNNIIGGTETGAGNRISFNAGPGVSVSSGTGNVIVGNSIFSNGGLGIDLSPAGVTANDPGDGDAGANNLQNFPLLTSVVSNAGSTTIQGTLNAKAGESFRIDFYSNAACDPSGNGEGALFLDTTFVTTDANGNASINFTSPIALAPGRVVTATATDPAGNTSEFSPCDSSDATGSVQFSSATYKVLEDVGNAVITVIRAGGSRGTLSVNYSTANGTAIAGSDYTGVSGAFVFADGETIKTFAVPIADDGASEADETVQLALTGVAALESLGSLPIATMIIQDNSTPLVLTMNSFDVPEGDSGTTNAVVTVSLSAQTGRTVTADYTTTAVTATSGVDFIAASGSLTFAPGVSTQGITVSVIGDTVNEINETFRVVLSNPINASIGNFSTVRILDGDPLTITSVGTPAGRTSGGQQIRLNGAFARLSTVSMGGSFAFWFFTNGGGDTTAITVTTPAHAVGAVQIDLTPTSGAGSSMANAFAYLPTVFTDNTLVVGVTTAKAQHILELRQAVDALRAVAGLGPAQWTDPALLPFSTSIKALHIVELRSFLEDAAARLGYAPGLYTDPGLSAGFVIKRVHIEELRQRIRAIAG